MNIRYLMSYISRTLHTFVRQYSLCGEPLEAVCERRDLTDILQETSPEYKDTGKTIISFLLGHSNSKIPMIFPSEDSVVYACVPAKCSIFLIGPVLLEHCSEYLYRLPAFSYEKEWLASLYVCSTEELIDKLLLMRNLFFDESITSEETILFNCVKKNVHYTIQKEFSDILFNNHEHTKKHNPYDREVREMSGVRNGDLEQVKKSLAEDYLGKIGTLAKNPLRHSKNHAIVLITLSSRAAIEGGLLPEISFSLSDIYIQKIEEATTPETAILLGRQAEYQYTLLVNEVKNQKNNPGTRGDLRISRCKNYIFSHLHEKISLASIAEELYLNKNYLCDLFKKEEGITIGEYILQQKIHLIQNMLIYSNYTYSEIATYFGFSSQSHLGRQFKKMTGMTLRQYREMYGVHFS
ncbi:MAG: helix-turn-helix domain-containing protein [Eubacteriales bacterium]|nr:helix-turn-helix domain-containing protein [Eubacteriales bacterium]